MKSFREKYAKNITSQNGENGIIEECINRMGFKFGIAVEIGAPTKEYCSNIYPLTYWMKYYFDIAPQEIGIQQLEVTPENINHIFVIVTPPPPFILSIDIDNNDYNVWEAYEGQPDIVIIEVNSSVPPPIEMLPDGRGASYMSMLMLGISKGYFLVCHTGNMIFVLNKYRHLFPEIIGDGIWNFSEYFNDSFL